MNVHLLLMVLALICFILAAVDVRAGKVHLLPAGLALWVASLIM